jgi:hypothetical protein
LTEKLKPIEWRYVPNDKPFTLVKCVAAKIMRGETHKPRHLQRGEYLYHIRFGILYYTIVCNLPIPFENGRKIVKLSNGEIVAYTSQKADLRDFEKYSNVKDEINIM